VAPRPHRADNGDAENAVLAIGKLHAGTTIVSMAPECLVSSGQQRVTSEPAPGMANYAMHQKTRHHNRTTQPVTAPLSYALLSYALLSYALLSRNN